MTKLKKKEIAIIISIIAIYMLATAGLLIALNKGFISKAPDSDSPEGLITEEQKEMMIPALRSAQTYFSENFVEDNGHINLYITNTGNVSLQDLNTNSEAVSYFLLWKAEEKDKRAFDKELDFVKTNMLHPKFGYMMWRLDSSGNATGDGTNIATDADLRTIKALMIAEEQWGDEKYTAMIATLASGLEQVGVTEDGYLAPYGGVSGENSTWKAKEVWLSYSDFTVFRELSQRRGGIWTSVYSNMKAATIESQLQNGLYNSMLTQKREYGNGIDGGGYSINSMWIMVRSAESGDGELMQSANKSLQFYKEKYEVDTELYSMYGSNGDALSPSDTAWVYALVGRAAIALGDTEFAAEMMKKLTEHQVQDESSELYGALPEGFGAESRVGQFTMQESIITMQNYIALADKRRK